MTAQPSRSRIHSIDFLRGAVIIIMALDHVRDFFGRAEFSPEDLDQTTPAWFFTRWITHFCAPVFVFLAGTSAFLHGQRLDSRADLSRFLFSRGVWLILLELLIVNPSWQLGLRFFFVQVIWALGWSMMVLAALIWLPNRLIALFGLVLVLGHNLLDSVSADSLGSLAWLWGILHVQKWLPIGANFGIFVVYPLIPWIGVIALGYVAGQIYLMPDDPRRRWLWRGGILLTVLFVGLRASNLYGDPEAWSVQDRGAWFTVLSFLNTEKYPPSLLFLAMTLGPSLMLLAAAERWRGRWFDAVLTFGRVPLFFYVIHVPLINLAAHIWTAIEYGQATNFFNGASAWPPGYETSLPRTYLAWVGIVLVLYWPCLAYARFKRRATHPAWSYL